MHIHTRIYSYIILIIIVLIFIGKPEGNRSLGRPRCKWEDNTRIKIDLAEIGWEGMDWTHLSQDRHQWRTLVDTVINLWIP
jgi:hypothetical protein